MSYGCCVEVLTFINSVLLGWSTNTFLKLFSNDFISKWSLFDILKSWWGCIARMLLNGVNVCLHRSFVLLFDSSYSIPALKTISAPKPIPYSEIGYLPKQKWWVVQTRICSMIICIFDSPHPENVRENLRENYHKIHDSNCYKHYRSGWSMKKRFLC